jgi:hypothetical protein
MDFAVVDSGFVQNLVLEGLEILVEERGVLFGIVRLWLGMAFVLVCAMPMG